MKALRGRTSRLVPVVAASALVLSACGGEETVEADPEATGGGSGDAVSGEVASDVSGSLSILHAFTGETDVNGLNAILEDFNEAYPNISVSQEGSGDFEQLARTRVAGGEPPDVILHPQPGLLEEFAEQGSARPIDFVDTESLSSQLVPGSLDTSTFDDQLYALPMRLSLKSLVWYNKPAFDEAGLEVPTTQDELLTLTEEVAAGDAVDAPWCIGIESGDATGWVGTDWSEDLVLRGAGADTYDQWVANEIPFDSPEVVDPVQTYMEPIWTNDEFVFGGVSNIVATSFGDSVNGIIDGSCMFHRQATFIEGFIQDQNEGAEFGTDYDLFYYPPITEGEQPALTAGDYAAVYTDNEAAQAFMQFLTTPEFGVGWAELGGYLSPFVEGFDTSVYPSESAVRASEILTGSSVSRFDGSDLMPGEVGASSADGSFWTEITSFAEGDQSIADAFAAIQELYSAQ